MNILCLGMNDVTQPEDGLPEYLQYFANIFSKKHKIVFLNVLTSEAEEKIIHMDINNNVKQVLVSIPEFFYPIENDVWKYTPLIRAYSQLKNFTPDIVFLHDYFFAPVLDALPIDKPIFYMVHCYITMLNETLGSHLGQPEISEDYILNHLADFIVANSSSTLNDIKELNPDLKKVSTAIPLGVNKNIYKPAANLSSKTILYIGRLDDQKGIFQFLNNIHENHLWLKENGYKIIVCGKGHLLEPIIQSQFDGMLDYLYQVPRERKLELIKSAKYMVFPSIYEPWGLSLNEGLACGKICIATNVGGHSEQIEHKKNGWLVKEPLFIEAIKEIESNPNLQMQISTNASNMAFDINDHFNKLDAFIMNSLKG